MKFRIACNKKVKDIVIWIPFCVLVFFLIYAYYHGRDTWKEDVDGDGVDETVKEYRRPDGQLERWEIEEDGTIHLILYYSDGKVKNEWMEYPDPENPGGYTIYVWDEETEQWLLDQNRNGAPDEDEQ